MARILKAARDSPLVIGGKEVSFSADYSLATRVRRKSCYPAMEKARLGGFSGFPALSGDYKGVQRP